MRYFTRFDNDGKAHRLYRFEVQENKILEEFWTASGWEWDKDARVVGYLSIADPDLDEITEDFAHNLFPEAFGLPVSKKNVLPQGSEVSSRTFVKVPKDILESTSGAQEEFAAKIIESLDSTKGLERRPLRHRIQIEGSSIVGTIRGLEEYEKAKAFLQEKSDLGKLKCFKWWCEECKATPLIIGSDPEKHVIKISIPNVLKVTEGATVKWDWKNPESEWALTHGNPDKVFQDLVDKKSRPNWVIRISAKESSMKYVFTK